MEHSGSLRIDIVVLERPLVDSRLALLLHQTLSIWRRDGPEHVGRHSSTAVRGKEIMGILLILLSFIIQAHAHSPDYIP